MRKFLTNGALLSSVMGFVPTLRKASNQRRTWKSVLIWISWGLSVAIAVAAVLDERDEEREQEIKRGHGARR